MSDLTARNEVNTMTLLQDALRADQGIVHAAAEAIRAADHEADTTRNVQVREKVHITHFIRFHDDWDFCDYGYVVAESDTHIRIADSQGGREDELTVTFAKDRDLLIKRVAL